MHRELMNTKFTLFELFQLEGYIEILLEEDILFFEVQSSLDVEIPQSYN